MREAVAAGWVSAKFMGFKASIAAIASSKAIGVSARKTL
jgi:hypothetical protein